MELAQSTTRRMSPLRSGSWKKTRETIFWYIVLRA